MYLTTVVMATDNKMTMYLEPSNFNEAWNHPDEESWRKWHKAIRKEFGDGETAGMAKNI